MHLSANCFTIDCEPCQRRTSDPGDEDSPVLQIEVESSVKASEVETMALREGSGAEKHIGVGRLLHWPLSGDPPHIRRGRRRLKSKNVATRPYHAYVPILELGVGVGLGWAFTEVSFARICLLRESKPKHIGVVFLFRLNTHAMNGGDIVDCVPLMATHYVVEHVAECHLREDIRRC